MLSPRFAADAMLGRLARWLCVLGFDTSYDATLADAGLVGIPGAGATLPRLRPRVLAWVACAPRARSAAARGSGRLA